MGLETVHRKQTRNSQAEFLESGEDTPYPCLWRGYSQYSQALIIRVKSEVPLTVRDRPPDPTNRTPSPSVLLCLVEEDGFAWLPGTALEPISYHADL